MRVTFITPFPCPKKERKRAVTESIGGSDYQSKKEM